MAFAVRLALGNALTGYPFLTFFPAIVIAAAAGGWVPATIAAVMSAGLGNYYSDDAPGSLVPVSSSGWLGLSFFAVVSATLIALVTGLHSALQDVNEGRENLRRLNDELEIRVRERTNALEKANAQLKTEIEARQAAQSQMQQIQKMEAVGQLTGGVAHDFNNMLAVIFGALDLARRRLQRGQGDILPMIDNALDGANRAATLTRRLLAFSRQQPLQPVVTDVTGLVQGMAELLRRTLGEAIELECVLSGGLWRTLVDPGQLESAILNLAVNARDAMPDGGKLTLETHNTHLDETYAALHDEVSAGQYVLISVSDTGTGMPSDVAARAFDPFFTTKGVGKGTGLGLSQVYGFIKQSGGHVKIYSEVGQGTTLKLYLKRSTGSYAVEGDPAVKVSLPFGSAEELILVVEDEDVVRRTTVEILRELGYTVRHARSGDEALTVLRKQAGIKLLFTDVVMPGMSGRQLADIALSQNPSLKVLYTTGYSPNAIVHNGVVDQGVDLITKPFPVDQLARKVRAVLDR